jgi:hypothetical protein
MKQIECWGNHEYDESTDTLYYNRGCGLCSNTSVLTFLFLLLKSEYDLYPQKIITNLDSYKNTNLYDKFFYVDKDKIQAVKDLDRDTCKNFIRNIGVNLWGLGTNKEQVNLSLIKPIFDAYMNLTDRVKENSNRIIKKYNIDENNFKFILWRKTDKIGEITWFDSNAKYPDFQDALNVLNNDLTNTVLQTDDISIFNEAKDISGITILNEVPLCPDTTGQDGVHTYFNKLSEKEHFEKLGYTHEDTVLNLLSILYLASKSKVFVGYPGNMSFFVCCLRNNFDNVYFFKDKKSFF